MNSLISTRNTTIDWAGYDPGQAYDDIIDSSGNPRKMARELATRLVPDTLERASSNN
jgi:hypothetical protein